MSGYYGFGNLGDEALLEAITTEIRRQRPDAVLRVLTANPGRARELGLEPVPRKSPLPVARALFGSDLLLSGGGGLVQDSTGAGSVAYYLGLVALARLLGRPSMLFCQGWGPIRTAKGRRLARLLTPLASLATLRDEESLRDVQATAPRLPARLTADPALLLEPPEPRRMAALLSEEGLAGEVGRLEGPAGRHPGRGPLVAVSVRPWPGAPREAMAEALATFARTEHARYVFVPFQPDRDREPSEWLASRLEGQATVVRPRTPRETLGLLGCMDMVLGMRLHALIFAAGRGVPLLGLSYDPKVERFCARAGGLHLPLEGLRAEGLATALVHLLQGRAHARRQLAERVAPMQDAARKAVAAAVALASGQGLPAALALLEEPAASSA